MALRRLLPFFSETVKKPNFLAYNENMKDALKPELIAPQKVFIKSVEAFVPNFSILQSECEEALMQTWESKCAVDPSWSFDKECAKKWAKKMSLRLRCMCRHVQQARVKKCAAPWFALLDLPPADVSKKVPNKKRKESVRAAPRMTKKINESAKAGSEINMKEVASKVKKFRVSKRSVEDVKTHAAVKKSRVSALVQPTGLLIMKKPASRVATTKKAKTCVEDPLVP